MWREDSFARSQYILVNNLIVKRKTDTAISVNYSSAERLVNYSKRYDVI